MKIQFYSRLHYIDIIACVIAMIAKESKKAKTTLQKKAKKIKKNKRYRASHIKSDHLYALKTKIRTLYLKIQVISARNILQWPYTIF